MPVSMVTAWTRSTPIWLQARRWPCWEKRLCTAAGLQIVVTRSPREDLVSLATDLHAQDTCFVDRFRWSIECTFSSMKARGFDLERTGITLDDRLERLFGLVTLAWVWCLRVDVDAAVQRPIQLKAHGR